jgi:molecular chaperone DnaK (HSP70)
MMSDRCVMAASTTIDIYEDTRYSIVDVLEKVTGSLSVIGIMGEEILIDDDERWDRRRTNIMLKGNGQSRSLSIDHSRGMSEEQIDKTVEQTVRWLKDDKTTELLRC